MIEYTKGPWEVVYVNKTDGYAVVDLNDERHLNVTIDHRKDLSDPTADAFLIAAAPDMFKALQAAVIALSCWKATRSRAYFDVINALKKAEGYK